MRLRVIVTTLIILLMSLPLLFIMMNREEFTVTIYRDEYGIPHIVGENEEAVMYGFGYAQAEDHLEDMIINYLTATGRLSEFLERNMFLWIIR